jgi:hypothetical protein
MENLVQNAKDKEITFGTYGPLFSLWGLQLGNSIQTKNMLVVNYKGETETLIGVSQGSIDLAFVSFRSAQIGVDNKQVRILAIGDIHGRDSWKDIINDNVFDKVVFLGDYFDSREEISGAKQLYNFKEILQFKKYNIDKVVLLVGNHEFHYLKTIYEQ